jgi:hypothetical protein
MIFLKPISLQEIPYFESFAVVGGAVLVAFGGPVAFPRIFL